MNNTRNPGKVQLLVVCTQLLNEILEEMFPERVISALLTKERDIKLRVKKFCSEFCIFKALWYTNKLSIKYIYGGRPEWQISI